MLWLMTSDLMLEFMVCNDRERLNELAHQMVQRTGKTWGEIVFAYSWVEADTQQRGPH